MRCALALPRANYAERDCVESLREIVNAIRFIRQTFTIFGSMVPRRASDSAPEMKWLKRARVAG